MAYLVDMVVLDLSDSSMNVYIVDNEWDSERMEEYIVDKGHKLSEVSWAIIQHFPVVYKITHKDDTWGYMTKRSFLASLEETNTGRAVPLEEDEFILEELTISY